MKILIAGAGAVGTNLAKQLSLEGHDVSIVEQQPNLVGKLAEKLDVLGVAGSCTNPSVLEEAGIESCDMVIAVTNIDEVNMITCLLASKYGVERKIARIRNEEIAGEKGKISLSDLHIDHAINPDQITVEKIVKLVGLPGTIEVAEFAGGKIMLRGFDVPSNAPIAGKRLQDLRSGSPEAFPLVVAMARGDQMMIPDGTVQIREGDKVYVIGSSESVERFTRRLNPEARPVSRIVLYGATPTAVTLAARLERTLDNITIIEPDEARAESAAEQLENTLVLRGEATDVDILAESAIRFADFFVALSPNDQNNLLAALLARKLGAKESIILTNEPDYVPVLRSVGIDVVINPRLITAGVILQTIRRGRVLSVVKLAGGEAEAMELIAQAGADAIGRKLRDRIVPKDAILGAIVRNGRAIVPDGDSVILPEDRLVVFSLPGAAREVEKLFSSD